MDDRFYVKKIVRDDGLQFEFDGVELHLSAENTLLVRSELDSSDISYTDISGGEMMHQKLPPLLQIFEGILYPKTSDYWTLYFQLTSFFKINHYYKIIYRRRSGELFAQGNAWIGQSLQISPRAMEDYSGFSVGMKLSKSDLMEYAEDGSGDEVYANSVDLPLLSASAGGELWNDIGQVWSEIGSVWIEGNGGVQEISIASADTIYPIWVVRGSAVNPVLQNNTTDTVATYTGTVASGQELVVDFSTGEARLDGALVTRNITGQVSFAPGTNVVGFNTDGGSATTSEIKWNNIIG